MDYDRDAVHPSTRLYVQNREIALGYDDYFRATALFQYDTRVLDTYLTEAGPLVDLGCGTARHLLHFARKGFPAVGVDLSEHMLACAHRKIEGCPGRISLIRGTINRLEFLKTASFRYAICMFSTIGLIRLRRNRARFVREVRRILMPRGLFIFHVHNRWLNLFDPCGRQWLWQTYTSDPRKGLEPGDKIMQGYRGIPEMFLHVFSYRESVSLVGKNGFHVKKVFCLNEQRNAEISGFGRAVKANGFIIVAESAQ